MKKRSLVWMSVGLVAVAVCLRESPGGFVGRADASLLNVRVGQIPPRYCQVDNPPATPCDHRPSCGSCAAAAGNRVCIDMTDAEWCVIGGNTSTSCSAPTWPDSRLYACWLTGEIVASCDDDGRCDFTDAIQENCYQIIQIECP